MSFLGASAVRGRCFHLFFYFLSDVINVRSPASLWKLVSWKFLKHFLIIFFFSPFSCPCLTLEGRSREISSSAPSIENISEKREFLLFGISTLIADAFEEFLLTPAAHHVNTERYSDDFFLLLADVLHLTTSSRSEKKEWRAANRLKLLHPSSTSATSDLRGVRSQLLCTLHSSTYPNADLLH